MPTSQPGSRRISPVVALLFAVVGAASLLYYHQGLFMPRVMAVRAAEGLGHGYSFGNDFYQVWLTAKELMLRRRDPYSAEMTREIQTGLYGRPLDPDRPGDPVDRRVFPYPAYMDLLFWPTISLSFPVARIVIVCLLGLLTAASVTLWLHALDWRLDWKWTAIAVLLTLCSYSALEGLFAGQLGLLVAFLFSAAILLVEKKHYLFAGALLALTTIKPQVTVLPILFLLVWAFSEWRSRGRLCTGFFSLMALLVGASLAVLPRWPLSWIHTVLAYRHYTRPPLVTEVLTSWLGAQFAEPVTLAITALAIIFAMALAWRARAAASDSLQFWMTLCVLIAVTTIVVLPGQAVYDHLILIPAILLVIGEARALIQAGPGPRILLWVGALVLFWQWIAAFGLIAARPLLPAPLFDATGIFSLPIRTAASLPFAVLALLAWAWRLNLPAQQAPA